MHNLSNQTKPLMNSLFSTSAFVITINKQQGGTHGSTWGIFDWWLYILLQRLVVMGMKNS